LDPLADGAVSSCGVDDDGWRIHWMHMRSYDGYMRVRVVDVRNIATNNVVGAPVCPSPRDSQVTVEDMHMSRVHTLFSALLSSRVVRITGQVVGRERFFRKGGGTFARTFLTLSDVRVTSAFDFFFCQTSPHIVHVTFAMHTCGRALVESCRADVHQGDQVAVEGCAKISPRGVAQINALSFTLLRKRTGSQWYYRLLLTHT
jgi:hypothetical protein